MIGVDEAGRGAWAGDLLAAAVRLHHDRFHHLLNDSKLMTAKRRQQVAGLLLESDVVDVAYGVASARLIDKEGLTMAEKVAMEAAVSKLHPQPLESIIVDGHINYLKDIFPKSRAEIKADQQYAAVMAASILAKVERDRRLVLLGQKYPAWGFEKHKGYGTEAHRQALKRYRPLIGVHRFSYRPVQSTR